VLGVVDYAHKPDSVAEVLAALRTRGRLICVIGAGGDRDRSKRPLMGAAAARGADIVIITDDNPRTEDPAAIRAELLAAAHAAADSARAGAPAVVEVAGRRAAIEEAVRLAAAGDVIALLGKGHERGQELGGEVYPFDDREELATALGARFGPNAAGAADPEPARVGGPR
jgi:UDP-N-acetylmuramoyl-L-alanyl-D-glutamate--2,6-diaminopimelate ligase